MASKAKKKEKAVIITIDKDLTIENISEKYQDFLNALSKKEEVSIVAENIENIDLTGLQFLIYAKQIEKLKKAKLTMALKFSETVTQLMRKTGFEYVLNFD